MNQPGPQSTDINPESSLHVAGHAAARLQVYATAGDPPHLIYRGCVSWNAFGLEDPFIIGRAVDESAEFERHADAAIIWMAPSALAVARTSEYLSPMWMKYDVPLKGGSTFSTLVVNPFVSVFLDPRAAGSADELKGRLLANFEDGRHRLDVEIKRQNTERFLDEALRRLRTEWPGVV